MEILDFSDLITPEASKEPDRTTPTETKADIKAKKEKAMERAAERFADMEAYITVSFANAEEKRIFCETLEIAEDSKFVKGSIVLNAFE